MKINKLLLERIVKEEVSSLREEYKLLENNIKVHEATLKEAWWDTLKRGVKKLTSSDLEDMAAEPETKKAVAETAEFMKKIKDLEKYEDAIEALKVSDINDTNSKLKEYFATFKEALEAYNATDDSKKSARFPFLQRAFENARNILGRILDIVSAASAELGVLTKDTPFAGTPKIAAANSAPSPSGVARRGANPTRSPISSPTKKREGGLAGGVVQENKRKSHITKK